MNHLARLSRRDLIARSALALGYVAWPSVRLGAQTIGPVMSTLSAYMAGAKDQPLPPDVVENAKHHILDTFAAMLSGSELPPGRAALDLVFSEHFNRHEPGIFQPLRDALMTHGDHYMHLADLRSYSEAHERLGRLYADPASWAQKAILNVACAGKFSSDRTIAEYARDIWDVEACPIG